MDTLVLLANIVGCSMAGTVYTMWAVKWVRRGHLPMAVLHGVTAAVGLGFGIGYALMLMEHPFQPVPASAFRPFVGLVLIVPAIARIMELNESEYREAFAREVKETLAKADGGS